MKKPVKQTSISLDNILRPFMLYRAMLTIKAFMIDNGWQRVTSTILNDQAHLIAIGTASLHICSGKQWASLNKGVVRKITD